MTSSRRPARRDEWIDSQVSRAVEPLHAHFAALTDEELREQALRVIDQLTRRIAGVEYDELVSKLSRKSEKLSPAQLALALEQLGSDDDEESDEADAVVDQEVEDLIKDAQERDKAGDEQDGAPKRKKKRKRKLPAGLHRRTETSDVSEQDKVCPCCGGERVEIGRDTREMLDLPRIRFEVLQHERIRRACPNCSLPPVTAPAPTGQYERLLASVATLAFVVCAKYDAHLPINRLERLTAQMGARVYASTMGGWASYVAFELRPLVRALWLELMEQWMVRTDATGMRVQDRDAPDGIRLGQMWCYLDADCKLCVFRFAPDGTGDNGPWTHLAGFEGSHIQADAANIFDRLFNGRVANAQEVGCPAHGRRKFSKLLQSDKRAAEPLSILQKVYRVEKAATLQNYTPEQRLDLRQRRSRGLMKRLHKWIVRTAAREPPKSAMRKACAYWINHWDALTRFLGDGRIPIDNTDVERQIRSVAVGRAGYLFVGNDGGGENAAIFYSLMRTCALNDVDPVAWLTDVLGKLADGWPNDRVAELLPHHWAKKAEQQLESHVA